MGAAHACCSTYSSPATYIGNVARSRRCQASISSKAAGVEAPVLRDIPTTAPEVRQQLLEPVDGETQLTLD